MQKKISWQDFVQVTILFLVKESHHVKSEFLSDDRSFMQIISVESFFYNSSFHTVFGT